MDEDQTIRILAKTARKEDGDIYGSIDIEIGIGIGIETNTVNGDDRYGNGDKTDKILTFPLQTLLPHGRRTTSTTAAAHDPNTLIESGLYLGYGTHYVEFNVGYPNPKRQTLIVDTGSSNTAFPCASCFACNDGKSGDEPREQFEETESETYEFFLCGDCKIGKCSQDDERRDRGLGGRRGRGHDGHKARRRWGLVEGDGGNGDAYDVPMRTRQRIRSGRQTNGFPDRLLAMSDYYDYDGDNQCHIKAHYEEGSSWRAIESEDWAFLSSVSPKSAKVQEAPTVHVEAPDYHPTYHPTQSSVSEEDAPAKAPTTPEKSELRQKKEKHEGVAGDNPNQKPPPQSKKGMDERFRTEVSAAKELSTRRSLSDEGPWQDPRQFRFRFACQTNLTGQFLSQLADGIAGMDRSDYSLWNQMWREKVVSKRQFSLCYAPLTSKEKYYKSHAGILTMGGTDTKLHKKPMAYADIMAGSPWYTIFVRAIYLEMPSTDDGGESRIERLQGINATEFNHGEIIFDSGTTDIFMPELMSEPFEEAWEKIMGEPYYDEMSSDDNYLYPNILIQMRAHTGKHGNNATEGGGGGRVAGVLDDEHPSDAIFVIPPEHYKVQGKSPLRMEEKPGDGGVLGAYAMMGNEILFDLENRRVGFAESDCQF